MWSFAEVDRLANCPTYTNYIEATLLKMFFLGVVSEVINDDNGTRIVLNEDLQSTKLYLRACYNCPPKGRNKR